MKSGIESRSAATFRSIHADTSRFAVFTVPTFVATLWVDRRAPRITCRASRRRNVGRVSCNSVVAVHQDHRCRTCRLEPGRSWLRRRGGSSGWIGAAVQADGRERDAQHLHLLLGRLRHPDLHPRRSGQERRVRCHPYRGRSGSSGQSRHALSEGIGAVGHRPFARPPQGPQISRAGEQTSSRKSRGTSRSTASPS